jgi:hypothetical protein
MTLLSLRSIRLDGGTQPRLKFDKAKVAEYLEAMVAGSKFPPIVVFFDGVHYWLADGFHRYTAYVRLAENMGVENAGADCEIHEGSQRKAILYSCGANAEHGLPRTNDDKNEAVKTMLLNPLVATDDDGNPWSAREIARICNVSDWLVLKVKSEVASASSRTCVSYTKNGKTETQVTGSKPDNDGQQEEKPEGDTPAEGQETGKVLKFTTEWDYLYDRLKDACEAIESLPAPDVVVNNFPTSLAGSLTLARVLEIKRWWLEFLRLWEARTPEFERYRQRQLDFIKEELDGKRSQSDR